MDKKFPKLFEPLRIRNTVFRNRIFSAPSMMCMAEWDGTPTEYMISYYREKARGGCAAVAIGDTPVDEENGTKNPRHLHLIDRNVNKLSELAFAIKANGAVAACELNHSGAAALNVFSRKPAWGPSAYTKSDGQQVLQMDETMMEHTIQCYREAARVVKKAGFDMCVVHAGHGWLLDQFLSPATNHRTDEYGGSLENRARFPLRVIRAIREVVGPDCLIDMRVSGDEFVPNGLHIEDCIRFIQMAQDTIDLVNVSAGMDTDPHHAIITHPNTYLPNGCNVRFAAAVKAAGIRIPVTTVGGINTPELAESILEEGKADAVAMCRALIADPEWPKKVREGRINEIRHCLRCTNCLGEMGKTDQFRCDVNPLVSRESFWHITPKAEKPKRVVICGGGPGGMTAAVTACERGHSVLLLEKENRLGGALNYTDKDLDFKWDLHMFKETLIARVEELPIEVRLNTEATPALVEQENADAVFVAIGAEPVLPPVKGLDRNNFHPAAEIYYNPDRVGKTVVIIGGGQVGAEAAIYLACRGHAVTVLQRSELCKDANFHHRTAILENLQKYGVVCVTGASVLEIKGGIVSYSSDGRQTEVVADSVYIATGYKVDADIVDALLAAAPEFALIGDCKKPFRVRGAVHDGYFEALRLG